MPRQPLDNVANKSYFLRPAPQIRRNMKHYIFSLPKDQVIPKNRTRYIAVKVADIREAKRVANTLSMAIATAYENPVELFVVEEDD